VSRMTRALLVAGIATLGAMAFVSSAVAKSGGNSTNAKLCQKGGYLRLYGGGITGSVTFSTEQACTRYAATGGTLTAFAGAAACSGSNVGFSVGGTDPFTDEPLIWHCGGSGDMPSSLVGACATDQFNLYGRTVAAPVTAEGDTWSFWCDVPPQP
jgi:hypothetical protein